MGKFGKVDGGVAVDGLRTYQTAVDRIEVEGSVDGMVGKGERHGVVHLAEECIIVGSVGGNGCVATQEGVFGTCTVEERLETGFALQSDDSVGGHYPGGLYIGSPMIACNDAAASILKATPQYGVHAVGCQLDHGHGKSPTESGVGGGIGGGESMGFLFVGYDCGLGQLHVGAAAESCILESACLIFECCSDILEVGGDTGSVEGVEMHVQTGGELAEEMVYLVGGIGLGLGSTFRVAFAFGKPVGSHIALETVAGGVDRGRQYATTIGEVDVLRCGTVPEEEFCTCGGKVGTIFGACL